MPDNQRGHFRSNRISTTTEDDSGIIGYQKYLHIMNRLAVDNTDAIEPLQSNLSQFLRVGEEEEEQEMTRKLELYRHKKKDLRRSGLLDDENEFMERTDESSYDDEDDTENELENEERMKKFSKFNFSGMSFKDYVDNVNKPNLG